MRTQDTEPQEVTTYKKSYRLTASSPFLDSRAATPNSQATKSERRGAGERRERSLSPVSSGFFFRFAPGCPAVRSTVRNSTGLPALLKSQEIWKHFLWHSGTSFFVQEKREKIWNSSFVTLGIFKVIYSGLCQVGEAVLCEVSTRREWIHSDERLMLKTSGSESLYAG